MKRSSAFSTTLRFALISICLGLVPLSSAPAASIELDGNFHPPFFAAPSYAARSFLLPDGKYLLYFNVGTLSDQPTGALMRFLPDGTFDSSFNLSRDYFAVYAVGLLPDGRLIVAASKDVYGVPEDAEHILRVNTDGSIDPAFNVADATITGQVNPPNSGSADVRNIVIQSDGKILLAGAFGKFGGVSHPGIVRLLADGKLDTSFQALAFQFNNPFAYGVAGTPVVQTDGKVIVAGDFDSVNGVPDPGVARLNVNGALDTTFNATGFTRFTTGTSSRIRAEAIQIDDRVILGGRFNVNNSGVETNIIRLSVDGSLDGTFTPPFAFTVVDLALQPDGKIVTAGNSNPLKSVQRFNTDGSVDGTFHIPTLSDTPLLISNFPTAFTVDLQNDGRILIGGVFDDVDDPNTPANSDHWSVARLNADGTLDAGLTTSHKTANRAYPESFIRQADDSTLLAFPFFISQGSVLPHGFGRLFANGSVDTNFEPVASYDPNGNFGPDFVFSGFKPTADGGLLAYGYRNFDEFGGFEFTYGKLFSDGTENRNFIFDPNAAFSATFPLNDGKTLISEASRSQNVVDNTQLRRLNTDGTVDGSFFLDPTILADTVQRDSGGFVTNLAAQSKILAVTNDGKILFSYLALDSMFRLVRLNASGSLDLTFPTASIPATTDTYLSFIVDGGQFFTEIPTLFSFSPGFTDALETADGKTIVTGDFPSYAGTAARGVVRLNADGAVDNSFHGGGGAQWTQTTETGTARPAIDNIELENDGKLLVSGTLKPTTVQPRQDLRV